MKTVLQVKRKFMSSQHKPKDPKRKFIVKCVVLCVLNFSSGFNGPALSHVPE